MLTCTLTGNRTQPNTYTNTYTNTLTRERNTTHAVHKRPTVTTKRGAHRRSPNPQSSGGTWSRLNMMCQKGPTKELFVQSKVLHNLWATYLNESLYRNTHFAHLLQLKMCIIKVEEQFLFMLSLIFWVTYSTVLCTRSIVKDCCVNRSKRCIKMAKPNSVCKIHHVAFNTIWKW